MMKVIMLMARSTHLRNKEFVISEILEDGSYKTYWDKIYI